jgi:hypothetical protein
LLANDTTRLTGSARCSTAHQFRNSSAHDIAFARISHRFCVERAAPRRLCLKMKPFGPAVKAKIKSRSAHTNLSGKTGYCGSKLACERRGAIYQVSPLLNSSSVPNIPALMTLPSQARISHRVRGSPGIGVKAKIKLAWDIFSSKIAHTNTANATDPVGAKLACEGRDAVYLITPSAFPHTTVACTPNDRHPLAGTCRWWMSQSAPWCACRLGPESVRPV